MIERFVGNIVANSKGLSISILLKSVLTGLEIPNLSAADVTASYWRQGDGAVQVILQDLATIDTIWQAGGWKQVDATLQPGVYRLDIPNESVLSGSDFCEFTVFTNNQDSIAFHERYNLVVSPENISTGVLETGVGNSYLSVAGADNYFSTRLFTNVWDEQTIQDKLKSLQQATRIIDRLNFKGTKLTPDQQNQFPRIIGYSDLTLVFQQTDVPDDIKIATCEIAINLLEGKDPDLEQENLYKISQSYSSSKSTRAEWGVPEHIRAGVPSATAWAYIRPYLVDNTYIHLERMS